MIEITVTRHEYNGNGVNVLFPYDFRIDSKIHMEVYVDDVLKTVDTHFTVSNVGDEDGGTVTFITAPPTGTGNVVLARVSPQKQLVDLISGAPFSTEEIEINALDKLCMMIQELQEGFERCLKFPITSTFRNIFVDDPQAGQILRWNATEDAVESVLASALEITHTIITQAILAGAFQAIITHNLNNVDAKLIGFTPTWGTGFQFVSQTVNTITIEFTVECPVGGGTLVTEVAI